MTQQKTIKTHDYKYTKIEKLIEQCKLTDDCACGSKKQFGGCCGRDIECSCKSNLSAGDCCFETETEKQTG